MNNIFYEPTCSTGELKVDKDKKEREEMENKIMEAYSGGR